MTDYIVYTNNRGDYLHIAIKWEINIIMQGIKAISDYVAKCRWSYPHSFRIILEWHDQGLDPRQL